MIDRENHITILDGAMGTMLQRSGLPLGQRPEVWNLTAPDKITAIHRAYIEAGAEVVYANTFGANSRKLEGSGYEVEDIVSAGIAAARAAVGESGARVALDMGPLGEMLEPNGSLTFEEAYACFARTARAGAAAGADLAVLETMTDLAEVKAGVLAVRENTDLPLLVSMTFEDTGRTFTGCSVEAMAVLLEGLGVDAVGINCSLGPDEIYPLAKRLCESTSLPVFVKPNAGLPDPATGEYHITPAEFARSLARYADLGVSMAGGCCGTDPDYIRALKEEMGKLSPKRRSFVHKSLVSTATRVVELEEAAVVGERINPTGKPPLRDALVSGDLTFLLREAVAQGESGANILDVNVGAPGVNEAELLPKVVKALRAVTDLPLQLDSSDPKALEAALRVYDGKPIINSVNGSPESMEKLLPLAKKYGAAFIALALDDKGIPKTAEGRLAVAERILNRALELGIPREDIYVDCLTLTVSAQPEGAAETLRAMGLVRDRLGLKTALGVSNISFGLPNRELLNSSFLMLALSRGLTLAIVNPDGFGIMDTFRAFRVLTNRDRQASDYIAAYKDLPEGVHAPVVRVERREEQEDLHPLIRAVRDGLSGDAAALTAELLREKQPMELVDGYLIPALDLVGAGYESGKLFLPQLLQAANAAQAAFGEVKKALPGREGAGKGPILLATVRGDIHDIGKNIVKVILENYGYRVIDLGRDVPPEAVVRAALETEAPLVGLSALMTTTLGSMKDTIRLLREKNCPCRIMVGGAVLTPEYALEIGADFYAGDAKQSADIAKKIIG